MILIIAFLLAFVNNASVQENPLLCVNINKNVTNVEYQSSAIDCIRKLENGSVKFTIASPDEALLASTFVTENVTVVGDFRRGNIDHDSSITTVVLTKGKLSLDNSNGLRYCHPGAGAKVPPSVLEEVLKEVLKRRGGSVCANTKVTILENFYHRLNSTLGPSCISGQWAPDTNLDVILKSQFPKLQELCQTYNQSADPFEQPLSCLISGKGDLILTSLQELENLQKKMPAANEQYFSLCKNNTLQSLSSPCIWSRQPWPLLVTKKEYTDRVERVQEKLQELSVENLMLFSNYSSLSTYMKDFREIPPLEDKMMCNRSIAWCTSSKEEVEECRLLQQAFLVYGIQPGIKSCKKLNDMYLDKYLCIDSLAKGTSDITFLSSDNLYSAQKAKLKTVMYTNNKKENLIRSVLIVNDTIINTIKDLKNRKACFSEFASIDWFSFVSVFKDDILKQTCFYDEGLSKFVGDSCMPGARDQFRRPEHGMNTNRVCEICEASHISPTAVNCDADSSLNVFSFNKGAIECLLYGQGEFAVIKFENNLFEEDFLTSNLKIMCKNGTKLERITDIDDNCYLSITPSGAIVTTENITTPDIRLAFMELSQSLQLELFPLPNSFLFGEPIKGFHDDESCNLIKHNDNCEYVGQITKLIREADTCSSPLENSVQHSMPIWIICLIVLIVSGAIAIALYVFKPWERIKKDNDYTPTSPNSNENHTELQPINQANN